VDWLDVMFVVACCSRVGGMSAGRSLPIAAPPGYKRAHDENTEAAPRI